MRVFRRIYLIGFADNVSKERQYKGYCLIPNERDFWKYALDYCLKQGLKMLDIFKGSFLDIFLIN